MKVFVALLALLLVPLAHAQDKIIVSGASGQLGSLVIDELVARKVAPENLILVSRTPTTDHLNAYAARGASVRFGDFSQAESLDAAYRGGTRMLLISINGGGGSRPELHKVAIDAAARAGVKHIAYTSYVNADRYTDSTIAGDHLRTERILRESGVAWTLLRNQIYANGLVDQAVQIVRDGTLRDAHAGCACGVRDTRRLRRRSRSSARESGSREQGVQHHGTGCRSVRGSSSRWPARSAASRSSSSCEAKQSTGAISPTPGCR